MTAEPIQQDQPGTKEAILAAAERLFAEHGVQGASLRAITGEAGVNLAAVNYHFGSKEGLVEAIVSRRLKPLSARRLELLDRALGASPSRPDVAEVVRAFVAPALEMIQNEPGGHAFARFILSAFQDPRPEMRDMLLGQFEETIRRFTDALGKSLPELPPVEIFWRFHFMVGVMAHTVGLGFAVERFSGGICDPGDIDSVTERMVGFVAGGLRSESTVEHSPKESR
jgi:AcrR family transcriptional regulator